MMKIGVTLLACALLFASVLRLSAEDTPPQADLPAKWQGIWKGKLEIVSQVGKSQELPMELHILPVKGSKTFQWQIVYGEGEKRQVREYELRPEEGKPGQFIIDEKSGILIDAYLVGSALYSQFQVSGNLISSRYELRQDRLLVEMTAYSLGEPRKTGIPAGENKGEPGIGVLSYRLLNVQKAELKRGKR